MTIVKGQVQTLKQLDESLRKSGITRFNSIGEIRDFTKSYELDKEHLPTRIKRVVDEEIRAAKLNLESDLQALNELESSVHKNIEHQISTLNSELERMREKGDRNPLFRVFCFPRTFLIARKVSRLGRNVEKTVRRKAKSAKKKIARLEKDVKRLVAERDKTVSKRCKEALKEISYTKQVVDELYPLVAGVIGETAVVNTLQPLSDDYYLINDFSLRFDRPIYNRKENDRIYSIQIDHLLICKAGIFLLETKNWSKASIQNLNLRSPVKQIKRTSFALFVLLNSGSRSSGIKLRRHHWGEKKIPIRNLIVMIHSKPKEEFKHVKVLSLNELIGYVEYFDQIFDGEEVKRVFDYLKERM